MLMQKRQLIKTGADNFANQEIVFDALSRDILDNAFQGYNACINVTYKIILTHVYRYLSASARTFAP